ncbi:DUF6538 domain-containing protein [Pseudooceanicola sp.]|uniref:DUF6538 domain-containing protein n=1 Tax=Pseudooceanicola sp. TaxID=1914328 RepID=UPI0040580D48
MNVSNCVDGVERRGNVYYLRWRVPAEFRAVETRAEINQSLKTRDLEEARALVLVKKKALRKVWRVSPAAGRARALCRSLRSCGGVA